jgi:hypothetical protein
MPPGEPALAQQEIGQRPVPPPRQGPRPAPDAPAPSGAAEDAGAPGPASAAPAECSTLTLGEVVERTAQSGFGFFLAFITLISVRFTGMSTVFGLMLAFGAGQMIIGFQRPWLPKRLRRVCIPPRMLRWIANHLARWTVGLERLVRPRFELMTRGPFWTLCGVGILVQALVLALPLPIPFTNIPFMAVILLYAIGLLEGDGLLIMICHALVIGEALLTLWAWETVREALLRTFT